MQHNVGLPTQYRFNVGSASQHIAGSMLVKRIRCWHNNETDLGDHGDCPVFARTAIRVKHYLQKGHYPDNTIHWPNCEIMLGHRPTLFHNWANVSCYPGSGLSGDNVRVAAPEVYIIVNIVFEDFLNTKVFNLGTSNVIFVMFIRTGVHKCQPFPTHSTPLSPKYDTNLKK